MDRVIPVYITEYKVDDRIQMVKITMEAITYSSDDSVVIVDLLQEVQSKQYDEMFRPRLVISDGEGEPPKITKADIREVVSKAIYSLRSVNINGQRLEKLFLHRLERMTIEKCGISFDELINKVEEDNGI